MITAFATGGYSGTRDRQPNKRSSAWAQRCLLMITVGVHLGTRHGCPPLGACILLQFNVLRGSDPGSAADFILGIASASPAAVSRMKTIVPIRAD